MTESETERFAIAIAASPRVMIEMNAETACAVLATIQFACRHPALVGIVRQSAERFARTVQQALGSHSALVGQLAERGWHPVFDQLKPDPGRN